MRHSLTIAAALVMLAALTGCPRSARIGGTTPADQVLDNLRKENRELERQVAQLSENIELRVARIEALEQQLQQASGEGATDQGVAAPQFTAVRFDRYSGFLDTNRDGADDTLRIYLHTLDQDGRFIPIAGRAAIQAVATRPGREPVVLIDTTIEPPAFRESYRSGYLGTHYTFEAPLPEGLSPEFTSAIVTVRVTDTATNITAGREAAMRLSLGAE